MNDGHGWSREKERPANQEVEDEVGKTAYARFDLNDYCFPHDRVHRTLIVVAMRDIVRVVDGTETLATHPRCWSCGERIEDTFHIEELAKEKGRARPKAWLPPTAPRCSSRRGFLAKAAERRASVGSITAGLLNLLERVSGAELDHRRGARA